MWYWHRTTQLSTLVQSCLTSWPIMPHPASRVVHFMFTGCRMRVAESREISLLGFHTIITFPYTVGQLGNGPHARRLVGTGLSVVVWRVLSSSRKGRRLKWSPTLSATRAQSQRLREFATWHQVAPQSGWHSHMDRYINDMTIILHHYIVSHTSIQA